MFSPFSDRRRREFFASIREVHPVALHTADDIPEHIVCNRFFSSVLHVRGDSEIAEELLKARRWAALALMKQALAEAGDRALPKPRTRGRWVTR